jgi:hypothetical protein
MPTRYGAANTRRVSPGVYEADFVAKKRAIRATWPDIAKMLGWNVTDLRRAFDPDWPAELGGKLSHRAEVAPVPVTATGGGAAAPFLPRVSAPAATAVYPSQRPDPTTRVETFTHAQLRLVELLLTGDCLPVEKLTAAFYGFGGSHRQRTLQVHLSRIRGRLAAHQIKVLGSPRAGWLLAPADKAAALHAALTGQSGASISLPDQPAKDPQS